MDTGTAVEKRALHLNRVLEILELDMPVWSTKARPVEMMYRESLVFEAIANRLETLDAQQEALAQGLDEALDRLDELEAALEESPPK